MGHSDEAVSRRVRLASGIPGFDEVVQGGLFRSSLYVINGAPGTGKTVLASQICFHAVANGERALYVTLFSELHANLIANLESFAFFDARHVSRDLMFVSAGRNLAAADPNGLLETLRSLLHDARPGVLVVDGFRAVDHAAWSATKVTMFVQGLQALVTLTGTTGLLVSSAAAGHPTPEQSLVEGIIDLEHRAVELRATRTLSIRKFRGGNHLPGCHVFRIDRLGVRVSPRLEARPCHDSAAQVEGSNDRLDFGVPGLDRLLGDGVAVGSTTLILGPAGSGKTILGMHLLAEGARLGQRGLHFGFFETPPALVTRTRRFALSVEAALKRDLLEIVWQPPSEQTPDELADRLLSTLRLRPAKRLFIDGAVGFEQVSPDRGRLGRFFAALSRELTALGVTTVVTEETRELFARDVEIPIEGVSAAWQNILFLRTVERPTELRRVLTVLKTRGAAHDQGLYEFTIGDHGFELGARVHAGGGARA
jgi:circadian clock protein KaiC